MLERIVMVETWVHHYQLESKQALRNDGSTHFKFQPCVLSKSGITVMKSPS